MTLLPIVGKLTALDLWPLTNLVLPAWLLLVLFPRWKYTPTVTLIPPLVHATIYTIGIFTLMYSTKDKGQPDFFTLEGIVTMFKDPNTVFIGWIHYCVHDLLVGRAIAMDAVSRGASTLLYATVVVPCLFFACMLGPVGFLMYAIARTILLPEPKTKQA